MNGDAFVTDDPELLEMLSADGKPAVLATIVRIREVFGQCGKAVIRAKLWESDSRGLAEAATVGGDFYTLTITESAARRWPRSSAISPVSCTRSSTIITRMT
ncbi:hypothetical protein ACWDTP_28895 [Mycobacterium sp. NPDC003449]